MNTVSQSPKTWDKEAIIKACDSLRPQDKGQYFICNCPRCGDKTAFCYPQKHLYSVIVCNHRTNCGYQETVAEWLHLSETATATGTETETETEKSKAVTAHGLKIRELVDCGLIGRDEGNYTIAFQTKEGRKYLSLRKEEKTGKMRWLPDKGVNTALLGGTYFPAINNWLENMNDQPLYVMGGTWDFLKAITDGLAATSPIFGEGCLPKTAIDWEIFVPWDTIRIVSQRDKIGLATFAKLARLIKQKFPSKTVAMVALYFAYDLGENGKDYCDYRLVRTRDNFLYLAEKASPIEFLPSKREAATAVATSQHLTDLGNSKRLVSVADGNIRYSHETNTWFGWDGRIWKKDISGAIYGYAREAVGKIYAEAASAPAADRQEIAEFAIKSESRQRIEAMVSLAESEAGIPCLMDEWDRNPWLLNVANGIIDLEKMRFCDKHQRDLNITKMAPTFYEPKAERPAFEKFLEKILPDSETRQFVQRASGYALSGDISEQVIFILYGQGANGKSVFLEALRTVLGKDFSILISPDILTQKQTEMHPTGLADLWGKRLVCTSETGEGRKLAEALIKQITGEDTVRARFMRQDFFEFNATHKIWLATNHKPNIRGTDYAIWRRIVLIPFEVKISQAERDKHLSKKLAKEASGILNWMLEGFRAWQEEGLNPPKAVLAATKEYREEQDVIARFIKEKTTANPNGKIQAAALYALYSAWSTANGEYQLSATSFGKKLSENGYTKYISNGTWYCGIEIT